MEYRVNYGNGQVSRTYTSLAEAARDLESARFDGSHAKLQRYEAGSADDPGMWVTRPSSGR